MDVSELLVTAESLRDAIAERIHEAQEWRRCDAYFVPFGKRADALIEQCQNNAAHAFRLLSMICSLSLKLDDPNEPFQPVVPWIDNLSNDQIDAIASVAPGVSDSELRARLCDLCWDRARNFQLAQLAVPAYVDTGKRVLASEHSFYWSERFERAIQIACTLRNDKLRQSAEDDLRELALQASTPRHVVAKAIELMLDYKLGMTKEIADRALSFATSSEATLIWEQRFFDLAARCFRRTQDEEAALEAATNHAESFVRQAAEALYRPQGGGMVAAHFVETAIHVYRQIPGSKARRDELHQLLITYQKQIPSEMFPSPANELDVSDLVRQAREAVEGRPLEKAIEILALSGGIPSKSQLKTTATESIRTFPLQFLWPATTVNRVGKTVARHGPTVPSDGTPDEEVVLSQMFWEARIHHQIAVVGRIEPMRLHILLEHPVRIHDFVEFVRFNPLIPPGRESLFARGLCAGLQGDLVEALHILIPQIENAVRYVLEEHGEITSGLSSHGIQMESALNVIFDSNEEVLDDIFGEDIVFELRGLLIDQRSSNLRNLLAHGLLYPESFQSTTAIYVWWIILRLVVIGRLKGQNNRPDPTRTE